MDLIYVNDGHHTDSFCDETRGPQECPRMAIDCIPNQVIDSDHVRKRHPTKNSQNFPRTIGSKGRGFQKPFSVNCFNFQFVEFKNEAIRLSSTDVSDGPGRACRNELKVLDSKAYRSFSLNIGKRCVSG